MTADRSEEWHAEELVAELLTTSRALVAIAIRSIAAAPVEVTVAQHRLLVLLAAYGPQSVGGLAEHLGVNPSNASRQADRLQRMALVRRTRSADDGRVVEIELTPEGQRLLDTVTRRRREELAALVGRLPAGELDQMAATLRKLNVASHELGEQDWSTAATPGGVPHGE